MIINVGKGMSEKAVASLWLVVYRAVCSSCSYLSHEVLFRKHDT